MSKLPRVEKKKDYHDFHLKLPYTLLNRMVEEGGVVYGEGNKFILEAISEKLDRLAKHQDER